MNKIGYIHTSMLDNKGVDSVFLRIAREGRNWTAQSHCIVWNMINSNDICTNDILRNHFIGVKRPGYPSLTSNKQHLGILIGWRKVEGGISSFSPGKWWIELGIPFQLHCINPHSFCINILVNCKSMTQNLYINFNHLFYFMLNNMKNIL